MGLSVPLNAMIKIGEKDSRISQMVDAAVAADFLPT
jgi:hypothetical protein